jgi:hypothetical protein
VATSGERKSFCVLDFYVNKCVLTVQRHFRTKFGTDPASGKSIRKCYLQFQDTGCICKRKSTDDRGRNSGVCPHQLEPSEIHPPGKPRTWYPVENCMAGFAETFANETIPPAVASSSEVIDHDMLRTV